MKITSSDRYLQLIAATLENSIVPELTSESSKGAAEIIFAILAELRKREGPGVATLNAHILQGESLESDVRKYLAAATLQSTAKAPAEDFGALIDRHASLTARLSALAVQLAAQRRDVADVGGGSVEGSRLLRRLAEWEIDYYVQHAALAIDDPGKPDKLRVPLTRELLEQFLNESRTEPDMRVSSFQPLLGGYGKQTYLFTVQTRSSAVQTEWVVRKTAPKSHMSFGFSTLEQEFKLLRALAKTDFPAPHPDRLASNWGAVDGSFFTMPRIRGSVAGSFLGGAASGNSLDIYLQLADLMAQLHTIPLETFSEYLNENGQAHVLSSDIEECYRRNLQDWRQYLNATELLPSPYLSWLFDWLELHVPRDRRKPVLVHGDFNIHNVLINDGSIKGVLDWECAGFGAPEQDLAYVRPHISKHIDWDIFIERYRKSGGPPVDTNCMQFSLVYSAIRLNVAGNRLAFDVQRGENQDIRYAMVDLGFTRAFMQMGLDA